MRRFLPFLVVLVGAVAVRPGRRPRTGRRTRRARRRHRLAPERPSLRRIERCVVHRTASVVQGFSRIQRRRLAG